MPFKSIVAKYLDEYKLELKDIKIKSLKQGGHTLQNPSEFQEFHRQHAVLRCIKKSINQTHR